MPPGLKAPSPEFHEPYPAHLEEPFNNPYTLLRQAIAAKQRELAETPVPPMFSPEEAEARKQKIGRDRMYGELGMLSRDAAIGGVAKPLLAEAIQASQKKQTDHGEYDPVTGSFTEFPSYRRRRQEEQLDKESAAAGVKESEAQVRWEDRRQRSREDWERGRQQSAENWARDRANAADRAVLAQALKAMNAHSQAGSFTYSGVNSETGEPLWSHSKELGMWKVDPATGKPVRHTGAVGPKASDFTGGERDAATLAVNNIAGLQQVSQELAGVKENWRTALSTGILPGAVAASGRAGQAIIEQIAPTDLNNAKQRLTYIVSGIRAGRFGLTLTPSEAADSVQYLPSQFDDLERTKEKAKGLEDLLTGDYKRWRESRARPGFALPGLPPPTPPGGPTPTPKPAPVAAPNAPVAAPKQPRKFEIVEEK